VTLPLVSIGIPLYRSARFVDQIARNLSAIDYPNVEILLSDRHRLDDALEQIAARFPGDPRLRPIAATDGVGWVDNFNLLLRAATGTYFMWMGHDDEYPPGFIPTLVACLEREPETLVAYGRVELVDDAGRPRAWQPDPELLLAPGEAWSVRAALRQLIFRPSFSVPLKGIFRREPVVRAGLYLRVPRDTIWADVYWVFALGLLGRPRYVPATFMRKRVHAASASARWGRVRLRDVTSGYAVLLSYIRDHAPGWRATAEATAMVSLWSAARVVASAPKRWRLPLRGRGVARKLLARALAARTRASGLP
jgi:GT2 family glycosyltransferase